MNADGSCVVADAELQGQWVWIEPVTEHIPVGGGEVSGVGVIDPGSHQRQPATGLGGALIGR